MHRFIEKTADEHGFAATWDLYVAPVLAAQQDWIRRRMIMASLTSGVAIGLAVAAFILWQRYGDGAAVGYPFSLFADAFFPVSLMALCALAAIAIWVPLMRCPNRLDEAVHEAVAAHMAPTLTPDENRPLASVLLQDLAMVGILPTRPAEVTDHFAGTYDGRRIRLLGADFSPVKASKKEREAEPGRQVTVIRLSLPEAHRSEVIFDTDPKRLAACQVASDGRLGRFHVEHDEFDVVFGVLAVELQSSAAMLPPEFAEILVGLYRGLVDPLASGRKGKGHMCGLIADGSMTVLVESRGDRSPAIPPSNPRLVDALTRRELARMKAVITLVDAIPRQADMFMIPPASWSPALQQHRPV